MAVTVQVKAGAFVANLAAVVAAQSVDRADGTYVCILTMQSVAERYEILYPSEAARNADYVKFAQYLANRSRGIVETR